jgi:Fe-S-cluster containining protein
MFNSLFRRMTQTIARPIWRRFKPRYFKNAVAHVRRGGAAAIDDPETDRVDVLLPVDDKGRITELARWALLAIEHRRFRYVKSGAAQGFATASVRAEYAGSVLDWCTRDAVHGGATRNILIDCVTCAACCHDSNVVLDGADLARFRDGGRPDLAGKAYIKRARDGVITLRFIGKGPCQHLAADRRCSIYELRPDNCRVFLEGSEACLAAREDTFGLRDGAPPEP